MYCIFTLLLLGTVTLVPVCYGLTNAEVKATIAAINAEVKDLVRDKDIVGICEKFTNDTTIIVEGYPTYNGTQGCNDRFTAHFARFGNSNVTKSIETLGLIGPLGSYAIEFGRISVFNDQSVLVKIQRRIILWLQNDAGNWQRKIYFANYAPV